MTDEALGIRVRDLLYRTRGRDWDYAFLLQPAPLIGEGWYAIHRRIFANVEPSSAPVGLRGTLGIGQGHPFFATAFTDAERHDHQGRSIAHYLVWLGQSADDAPGKSFGPGLVESFRPALDAVFDLVPEQLMSGETLALDSVLRQRFGASLDRLELTITNASAAPVRWLGTVAV